MSVDINGITLTAGTNTLTINNNSNLWSWNASGHMRIANQPACQIGNNDPNWQYWSGWLTFPWVGGEVVNRHTLRQGNRFYAPQTGMYVMAAQSYALCDQALVSDYFHPLFSVNGSYGGSGGRGGSTSTTYRIRHYGVPSGGYCDLQTSDIKYLQTGDWVEFVVYSNNGNNRHYKGYSFFSIGLLG